MAKTRAKDPVPADEIKSAKFRRLANSRLPKTIKAIDGIANLAGPTYERTPAQVELVVNALKAAVARVEKAYAGENNDVPVI